MFKKGQVVKSLQDGTEVKVYRVYGLLFSGEVVKVGRDGFDFVGYVYNGWNVSAFRPINNGSVLKFKKLRPDAVTPAYAKPGDAAFDLTAVSKTYDKYGNVVFGFGLAFEIPDGHVGFIFMRSSGANSCYILANAVGVIDSGYRGEVTAKMTVMEGKLGVSYNIGDRVAQMVIMKVPEFTLEEAEELSVTERGTGGYGSTGK